ncbi:MAG: DNA-directed RNA polymerase specialized sigma24 family protein [Planctomycetota bacterium]
MFRVARNLALNSLRRQKIANRVGDELQHWERGDHQHAVTALEQALSQPCSNPERRLLEQRLAACRKQEAPPPW